MKILISLLQMPAPGKGHPFELRKELNLPIIPYPGAYLEYESGWGCVPLVAANSGQRGLQILISAVSGISIGGYGPRFTDGEITSLVALGWHDSRVDQ